MNLDTNFDQIEGLGIGEKSFAKLKKLGLETPYNLLFYFPRRYLDYSEITKIGEIDLQNGAFFTIQGELLGIANKKTRRKHFTITEAVVADESGSLKVVWFNQPYLAKMLRAGQNIKLHGKVAFDSFSHGLVMESPNRATGQEIVPIYSETKGMTSFFLMKLFSKVKASILEITEWLSDEIIQKHQLLGIKEALLQIHEPRNSVQLRASQRRLAFDELFLISLRANLSKEEIKKEKAPVLDIWGKNQAVAEFVSFLPFKLTGDQEKAVKQILGDMEKNVPMNRLLNGDVGSGKTVVAAISAFVAVKAGYRVAIMCPTSILANQHYETFCKLFEDYSEAKIGLYTRERQEYSQISSASASRRRDGNCTNCSNYSKQIPKSKLSKKKQTTDCQPLTANIVIGTQALIQESVKLDNLGLVVVDEQHRFGVAQRAALQQLGNNNNQESRNKQNSNVKIEKLKNEEMRPHFLSMTATPIPRTLHLALFGDLDISVIREKPADRKEIKTRFVSAQNREKAYQFIRVQIIHDRQVFVICPLIEAKEDESGQLFDDERKSVKAEYDKLKSIYPEFKIEMLHGKMKAREKDAVMADFAGGQTQILVSTSVVEVGVDIPNASVMVIEDAERFGLAQIHQFRGRVGRAEHQSFCFLFSSTMSEKALKRLASLEETSDGFRLAEIDLETRGPGAVFGTEQSGLLDLQMASLADRDLIEEASLVAKALIGDDPELKKHPLLMKKITEYINTKHLE